MDEDLKGIVLSEKKPVQKITYCMIPVMRRSEKAKRGTDQWLLEVRSGGRVWLQKGTVMELFCYSYSGDSYKIYSCFKTQNCTLNINLIVYK